MTAAKNTKHEIQYAVRSFADALDDLPMALAENAGLSPITELSAVKSRQIAEGISSLGIDCNQVSLKPFMDSLHVLLCW